MRLLAWIGIFITTLAVGAITMGLPMCWMGMICK